MSEEISVSIAEMKNDLKWIKKEMHEFKTSAEVKYVSKIRFQPIEKLVYGMVGFVMIAVGSAVVAGVIKAAEIIIDL